MSETRPNRSQNQLIKMTQSWECRQTTISAKLELMRICVAIPTNFSGRKVWTSSIPRLLHLAVIWWACLCIFNVCHLQSIKDLLTWLVHTPSPFTAFPFNKSEGLNEPDPVSESQRPVTSILWSSVKAFCEGETSMAKKSERDSLSLTTSMQQESKLHVFN